MTILVSGGRAIDTDGLTEKDLTRLELEDLSPRHRAIVEKLARTYEIRDDIWGPVPDFVTEAQRPWWERDCAERRARALRKARNAFDLIKDEIRS